MVSRIGATLDEGYTRHALQSQPHLVLLDVAWYHEALRPLLAKWALLWLHRHFVGAVRCGNAVLLEYLEHSMESDVRNRLREKINGAMLPESIKLLNLAAQWIQALLPHCLSKINRVSYGLLSPADVEQADPRTPQSRLLMSVPFIGKDVPSRSSEVSFPKQYYNN